MAFARMFAMLAMPLLASTHPMPKMDVAAPAPAPKKAHEPKNLIFGKIPETTAPSVPQPTPWPVNAPKATTKAPAPKQKATPAPAEPLVRVLEGDISLTVIDVDAFLRDAFVKSSLQAAVANLLALTKSQVEISTMAAAEEVNSGPGQGRRLTSGPGKVNVKYTITDPSKTVTPAKVSSIAAMLPASVNNQLNAQSQLGNTFISTAIVPDPTLRTTTTTTTTTTTSTTTTTTIELNTMPNPCAVVDVAPVVAAPKATGWNAKTLFKINKAGGEMVKSLYPKASWIPAMFCLAVPALIGLAVLVRNVVHRRATRSLGQGFAIMRDAELQPLECELTEEEGAESWD